MSFCFFSKWVFQLKETTLEIVNFTLQLLVFVTVKKETRIYILLFHSSLAVKLLS